MYMSLIDKDYGEYMQLNLKCKEKCGLIHICTRQLVTNQLW